MMAGHSTPHSLFVLPKRKRAGHGTQEHALRDELPGKAVNSPKTGGWPSQTADQIQKSSTGCADRHTSKNCVPAFGGVAFIGAAKPDLTCFSFRAFRFAKRCPAL